MRLSIALILLGILSCGRLEKEQIDPNEVRFKTTDASKLFFKNTRQIQYRKEVLTDAKLEVFRWKKALDQEQAQIELALVNNWRYDEAYILLEPNDQTLGLNQLLIQWTDEEGKQGEIKFIPGNKSQHAIFAGKVYQRLQQNCSFQLKAEEGWIPILNESESRKAFQTTVFDYYRLTERL